MRSYRRLLSTLVPFAVPVGMALLSTVGCARSEDAVGDGEEAVLDTSANRGVQTATYAAPDGTKEICVVPQHLAGGDYKKGDADDEKELCGYDFYNNVKISPKTVSTNPGTDIEDAKGKTLAKFKQSITCSYTPSILGYYHLSRALGGVGDVKPAVVRTIDLEQHKKISAAGVRATAGQGLINTLWKQYATWESNPSNPKYKDLLFTSDLGEIYGALQVNPRGEVKYKEINVRAAGDDISARFRQTSAWAQVTSGGSARSLGKNLASFAQPVQLMRDISDMVLIDTLMSQQDRYGNIHAVDYYYYVNSKTGKVEKVKQSKVEMGEAQKPAGAVAVRKMLLKDNDCGVVKTNVALRAHMLESLRHMSPKTYKALRWLNQNFGPNMDAPKFFVREALFTQRDLDMLRANLKDADAKLHSACTSGKLLLDLDMEDQLAGKPVDASECEKAEAPGGD